jgi:hypothetical protein
VPQLAFAGGQPVGNVAQTVDRSQLAKQHGHELVPAAESLGIALGSMLAHGGIETGAGNQFQNLEEMLDSMDKAASSS